MAGNTGQAILGAAAPTTPQGSARSVTQHRRNVDTTVIRSATEDLDPGTRAEIIQVCVAAHHEPDFERLFSYIPSGGRHFIAYRGKEL